MSTGYLILISSLSILSEYELVIMTSFILNMSWSENRVLMAGVEAKNKTNTKEEW
jgi:hypothetical protein